MTAFIVLWLIFSLAMGLVGNEREGKFLPAFISTLFLTPLIGGVLTLLIKRKTGTPSVFSRYRPYIVLGYAVFTLLAFTLPFHYVPDDMKIFTKEHWTFKNTLILRSDAEELLNRYNNASLYERMQIREEPLFKILSQEGLIHDDNP